MVLRKSFYIRWSAGRSPRVHEVNPGRDPSVIYCVLETRAMSPPAFLMDYYLKELLFSLSVTY